MRDFRVRSPLPVARPAADLSQPYAPPVGLSLAPPAAQGSEASPAARTTLDSERIPRASKLLICGLFQKGRVLAQDGGLIGLLADTAGNFAGGSVSPGSTVKTVEFKMSLLEGVQKDLLAIGEVVRKGRTLATCRLEVVGGNDHVVAIGLATYALQAV